MLTAEVIDAYRTMPRVLVAGYAYLVWDTVQWFQQLADPSSQHAFLVSTVVGGAAAVFGLYVNSGKAWDQKTTNKEHYFETNTSGSSFGTSPHNKQPNRPYDRSQYGYNSQDRYNRLSSVDQYNRTNSGDVSLNEETPPPDFLDQN